MHHNRLFSSTCLNKTATIDTNIYTLKTQCTGYFHPQAWTKQLLQNTIHLVKSARTDLCIHVSSIHVDLPTVLMNNPAYFINPFFIDSMGRRVGNLKNHLLIEITNISYDRCFCQWQVCNIHQACMQDTEELSL